MKKSLLTLIVLALIVSPTNRAFAGNPFKQKGDPEAGNSSQSRSTSNTPTRVNQGPPLRNFLNPLFTLGYLADRGLDSMTLLLVATAALAYYQRGPLMACGDRLMRR